jgi:hypothetical protein
VKNTEKKRANIVENMGQDANQLIIFVDVNESSRQIKKKNARMTK